MCKRVRWATVWLGLVAWCGGAVAQPQPEGASGWNAKPGWATRTYAIAAANPLATEAGRSILQAGGSAVDAAIATQMVLTLVEPQSSGIGGGAFLLHFDGKRTQAFDGRETAPLAATEALFVGPDGKPMGHAQAVVGGRAVGVPGVLAMLHRAHQKHGKLPWARLFQPAIDLAKRGFPVSPRLAIQLATAPHLRQDPDAARYFFDAQGQPWPAGHVLRNPELAAVLQRVATQGPDAVMRGGVAQAMVSKVRGHAINPGTLTLQDLQDYRARLREPLCFDHRAKARDYRICGMPPPSSGALTIGQILGLLNTTGALQFPMVQGLPSADWLHLYVEASRLAFADRAQYVADPAFVPAPAGNWNSLLEPGYLRARAARIDTQPDGLAMPTVTHGYPGRELVSFAPMPEQQESGTSHISIVDARGHAVAMTTSIEHVFGAGLMVNRGRGLAGGFMLNNQLTDFSFVPADAAGKPIANRVEPGKRPRSSMSPTLVFDKANDSLMMTLGSPGGPLLIHFTAKTLLGMLHGSLNAQQAIDLPNFGSLGGPVFLEEDRFSSDTVQALQTRGHVVRKVPMPSGLQAIERTATGWFGGADPRREGSVLGD